jgi:hypothetical protein
VERTRFVKGPPSRASAIVAFLAVWLGLTALVALVYGFRERNELVVCYLPAAERLLEGRSMFREAGDPDAGTPGAWVYPPAMIVPVLPAVLLERVVPSEGQVAARIVWSSTIALSIVLSLQLLLRAFGFDGADEGRRRALLVALVVAALIGHRHLIAPVNYLSHDWLVALALVAVFAASVAGREAGAGLAAGVGGALKVTPALLVPVFLVERRFKAAFVAIATGVASLVVADLLLAGEGRRFVFLALGAADVGAAGGGLWSSWNVQAQNLSAILGRWCTPSVASSEFQHVGDYALVHLGPTALRIVTLTASVCVVAAVLATAFLVERTLRRDRATDRAALRLLEVGAVACGMVLLPPHSSKYHFAVVVLAILAITMHVLGTNGRGTNGRGGRDPVVVALFAVLVVLGLPLGRDLVGELVADLMLLYGAVGMTAVVALVAVLRLAWLADRDSGQRGGCEAPRTTPPATTTSHGGVITQVGTTLGSSTVSTAVGSVSTNSRPV